MQIGVSFDIIQEAISYLKKWKEKIQEGDFDKRNSGKDFIRPKSEEKLTKIVNDLLKVLNQAILPIKKLPAEETKEIIRFIQEVKLYVVDTKSVIDIGNTIGAGLIINRAERELILIQKDMKKLVKKLERTTPITKR